MATTVMKQSDLERVVNSELSNLRSFINGWCDRLFSAVNQGLPQRDAQSNPYMLPLAYPVFPQESSSNSADKTKLSSRKRRISGYLPASRRYTGNKLLGCRFQRSNLASRLNKRARRTSNSGDKVPAAQSGGEDGNVADAENAANVEHFDSPSENTNTVAVIEQNYTTVSEQSLDVCPPLLDGASAVIAHSESLSMSEIISVEQDTMDIKSLWTNNKQFLMPQFNGGDTGGRLPGSDGVTVTDDVTPVMANGCSEVDSSAEISPKDIAWLEAVARGASDSAAVRAAEMVAKRFEDASMSIMTDETQDAEIASDAIVSMQLTYPTAGGKTNTVAYDFDTKSDSVTAGSTLTHSSLEKPSDESGSGNIFPNTTLDLPIPKATINKSLLTVIRRSTLHVPEYGTCGYCDNYFSQLRLHVYLTHRPFSCDQCPYRGIKKENLRVHIRTVHNKKARPQESVQTLEDLYNFAAGYNLNGLQDSVMNEPCATTANDDDTSASSTMEYSVSGEPDDMMPSCSTQQQQHENGDNDDDMVPK